jgi:restriction endonuclease S subunit
MMRFNESANPFFILNLLATSLYEKLIGKAITGATVTGLTKGVVRNLKIPLPSPEKQTEIATHISALRTQAKQLQQQAATELAHAKLHIEHLILGE